MDFSGVLNTSWPILKIQLNQVKCWEKKFFMIFDVFEIYFLWYKSFGWMPRQRRHWTWNVTKRYGEKRNILWSIDFQVGNLLNSWNLANWNILVAKGLQINRDSGSSGERTRKRHKLAMKKFFMVKVWERKKTQKRLKNLVKEGENPVWQFFFWKKKVERIFLLEDWGTTLKA